MTYFKQAARSLLKSPMITTVAVLSLALGIGANAAIFSLFEQLLLRPLPVQAPDELVNLTDPGIKSGSVSSNTSGGSASVFSYRMFRDLEQAEHPFVGIAGHQGFGANLAFQGGETRSGSGILVTGRYFELLGLRPHLGRLIQASDDEHVGAHPVVVLSHAYWRHGFGSDDSIIDKTLVVNGKPMTVIGVAPEGFRGTTLGSLPDIFAPITMKEEIVPGWKGFENRRSYWLYMFARLEPGQSMADAQQAVNAVYGPIIREVELPLQEMSEASLTRFGNKELVLEPGRRGQSSLHEFVKTPLYMLFSVTGFVLLIACANLINLLLIRAAQRTGEIAVRMSIGARRGQVVTQLLTESFLLALAGAVVGLGVARLTLRALVGMMPEDADLGLSLVLGSEVWIFTAVLSVLIGMVGLFPALHVSKENFAHTLKAQSGRAGSSRGANRFRAAMATLQIALSMILLIGAGLMIKSLANVARVDLGLDVDRLVTFSVSPELNGYTDEASASFFRRVEEEVGAVPGVDSVVASVVPLISGSNWGSNVSVQGFDADPDTDTNCKYNQVGPGFFSTMGIDILAGREFTAQDGPEAGKVAVVNQAFAKKFQLDEDKVVGTWMQIGSGGENDIQIVGLVRDAKYSEVKREIPPMFILPYRQDDSLGSVTFYVRTAMDPAALISTLRGTLKNLDPNLPVDSFHTMAVQVEKNIFLDRLLSLLSTAFALLATLLASIGLYGVLAYSVVQRHKEIGLRMALGADAGRVRRWVLKQVLAMVAVGAAVGIVVAFNAAHLGESVLFGLSGKDPVVFVAAVATLAGVALLAGFLPAYRAGRTDPIEALRDD